MDRLEAWRLRAAGSRQWHIRGTASPPPAIPSRYWALTLTDGEKRVKEDGESCGDVVATALAAWGDG